METLCGCRSLVMADCSVCGPGSKFFSCARASFPPAVGDDSCIIHSRLMVSLYRRPRNCLRSRQLPANRTSKCEAVNSGGFEQVSWIFHCINPSVRCPNSLCSLEIPSMGSPTVYGCEGTIELDCVRQMARGAFISGNTHG